MKTATTNSSNNNNDDRRLKNQFQQLFIKQEIWYQREFLVVGFLWMVGYPLMFLMTKQQNDDSTTYKNSTNFGKPIPQLCGLMNYSITSASNNHATPPPSPNGSAKIESSDIILVIHKLLLCLFAVLILQYRSTQCNMLKLGWLQRFSLVSSTSNSMATKMTNSATTNNTVVLALQFWQRIVTIEKFGYLSSGMIFSILIFDESFTLLTLCLPSLAFALLLIQNGLMTTLETSFSVLFVTKSTGTTQEHTRPKNQTRRKDLLLMLAAFHFFTLIALVLVIIPFIEQTTNQCGSIYRWLGTILKPSSKDEYDNNDDEIIIQRVMTLIRILSAMLWSNEYALGLITLYTLYHDSLKKHVPMVLHFVLHYDQDARNNTEDIIIMCGGILSSTKFSLYQTFHRLARGIHRTDLVLLMNVTSTPTKPSFTKTTTMQAATSQQAQKEIQHHNKHD